MSVTQIIEIIEKKNALTKTDKKTKTDTETRALKYHRALVSSHIYDKKISG